MQIDVTSVSRKEQKLSRTPAAVYVLTHEAIEGSGASNIPDLLRIVPGVQVAQLDANRWAISVRGFNGIYSSKLLVLVDGRTIYTPIFSGVFWDQLDIPFELIDRIEVVRGPGGTVWGANAVNGVINIITKKSQDTQGIRIEAGSGSSQSGDFDGRFGGALGSLGAYRVSGDFHSLSGLPTAAGLDGHDGWHQEHAGLRADVRVTPKDSLMLEGDATATNGSQTVMNPGNLLTSPQDVGNRSYSIIGRWNHSHSDNSDTTLQIYGSGYTRHDAGRKEHVDTLDFDFQHHSRFGSRNDVVWGAGYRFDADDTRNLAGEAASYADQGAYIAITPAARKYNLFSTFLQDEISISPTLALTLGSKFEHNAFSGFEYEPSARLAWTPTAATTWWVTASQAVEQPTRVTTGMLIQLPPNAIAPGISMEIVGNPQFRSKTVRDYELGYRVMPFKSLSFDLATFYAFYKNLQNVQMLPPVVVPQTDLLLLNLRLQLSNGLKAQDYGAEASVTWSAVPRWRLNGSYSWLKQNVAGPVVSQNPTAFAAGTATAFPPSFASAIVDGSDTTTLPHDSGGTAPAQQFGIHSSLDVSARASLDSSIYYVGALPETGVPSYVRLDSLLRYKFTHGVEASLVGQNLLTPGHIEFLSPTQAVSTQATRSIFGRIVWSF